MLESANEDILQTSLIEIITIHPISVSDIKARIKTKRWIKHETVSFQKTFSLNLPKI